MKTKKFRFLNTFHVPPTLFRIAHVHSPSSTKTTSWHELPKSSYLKPNLWLWKVDIEKLGPIQSSHISADALFDAEFESVSGFHEKRLARPIINDFPCWFHSCWLFVDVDEGHLLLHGGGFGILCVKAVLGFWSFVPFCFWTLIFSGATARVREKSLENWGRFSKL